MRKTLTLLLTVGILANSGCLFTRSVYYHQRYPVMDLPDRPKLGTSDKDNVRSMIEYARKLEGSINVYNEFATRKNKKVGRVAEQ